MGADLEGEIDAVRKFNRFYTQRIGVLEESLLSSAYSLTQARVLFEIGSRRTVTAGELIASLGLDPGYLSRILQRFANSGLLSRRQSSEDARRTDLSLTAKGRKAFCDLDQRSRLSMGGLLAPLSAAQRAKVLRAMQTLRESLSAPRAPGDAIIAIRPYGIGDIGWAIERHAQVYADEFGWNRDFEALVATLFAGFCTRHDPATERLWIAEVDGERAGCVFVVRSDKDPQAAQLRCLLVEPRARGLGLGRQLVEECIRFAKLAGYARIMLWTNDVLDSARRLYEWAGFSLVEEHEHTSFGHELVGQIWMRPL